MNRFAKRVTNAPRSFTRKILEVIGKDEIISFAGGLPDVVMFPHKEIEEELKKLMGKEDKSIYQYSSAKGLKELRVELAKKYKNSNEDEILITNGSQQGLDLLCKAFIDEKDTIIVESPSYLAALNLFALYDANVVEVSLSSNGVDLEKLEILFKTKKPKFFYSIPTFQNPTGWSYENENRKEVAKLAKKYDILIVEDSPYNDLRYTDEKLLSFEELIPNRTINLGTFSKTLVPDFRLGWMRADEKYINVFQSMKENSDLQSPRFLQYVVANLLKDGQLSLHVEKLCKSYKEKRDYMKKLLVSEFGKDITFETPKGGMFFWIDFRIDTMKFFDFAIKEGIAFVPGCVFFKDSNFSCPYARLNFTNASLSEIEDGIKRLKSAYNSFKS